MGARQARTFRRNPNPEGPAPVPCRAASFSTAHGARSPARQPAARLPLLGPSHNSRELTRHRRIGTPTTRQEKKLPLPLRPSLPFH